MAEVQVIARFVAREGKENQLRALLQSMLAPTRAESGCELYELYESDSWGRFFSAKQGQVKLCSINIWQRPTLNAWNKLAGNSSENPSRLIS